MSSTDHLDDYSPSATTTLFPHPPPLLRGPLPATPTDDPSSGPFVLAFRDIESWSSALASSKSKILEQCGEGARIGCAVAASRNCAPPWWAPLAGRKADLKQREECEVREMESCLIAAKEKCADFAVDKCSKPFMDARVAVVGKGAASERVVVRQLISRACFAGKSESFDLGWFDELGLDDLVKCGRGGVSYVKASELVARKTGISGND
ncbi:uncharacterized protein LOC115751987 [Rhodamnia argentea]|uniref:Uncharacterized protein LOC115751987 n=1 Tax=Rhodamnia argentea TaxID=178133 RepID=A0A8B8QH23_9MYRT|nr:uncharacterized protein LOC115751987 [Rhodamnia argentea]XP_030545854.2 uncharacterized protein LOC115751987 [Rhodamnia argentea]XP_048137720.1 uncharacterized protein LOC115751987 [Rhodamnia argentea]